MALIILQQILVMSLYMLIGFLLYKTGIITQEGSRSFAGLLAYVVIPSTILNSFMTDFSSERLRLFGISFVLGLFSIMIAVVISALFFRNAYVDRFAATFSNAGFIGIPLVKAAIGDEGLFYLVGVLIWYNLVQWTYGMGLLRKAGKSPAQAGDGLSLRKLLTNPIVIAAICGFLLFVSGAGTSLPPVLSNCISGVASLNAPMAMIVLGVYLAQSSLIDQFTSKRLYAVTLVRLVVIPAATILVLSFMPVSYNMKMTIAIATSASVGANVAVYSQICGADYVYACRTVTHSTIFSIVLMPLMMLFAGVLIHP